MLEPEDEVRKALKITYLNARKRGAVKGVSWLWSPEAASERQQGSTLFRKPLQTLDEPILAVRVTPFPSRAVSPRLRFE